MRRTTRVLYNDDETTTAVSIRTNDKKNKRSNNIRKPETNLTLLFTPRNLGSQVVVEVQKSLAIMEDRLLSVVKDHVNKLYLE